MKRGLVLEGGGMRGLFSEGVFDVLLENGIMLDALVGVSAGVLFGCNYKSGQIGRGVRYNTRFAKDPRYMSVRSLLTTGNYVNEDFAYGEMPLKLDKFDFEAFNANDMEFHIVCTDIVTGEPVYKKYVKADESLMDWMRASGSMPLVSKPVVLEGHTMLDGGIVNSIPLEYAQSVGLEKNIVVLTQPRGYQKKPFKATWLFRMFVKKYPKVAEKMAVRHEMYNKQLEYVYGEADKGNVLLIIPDEPLNIGRVEGNPDKMRHCYEMGRRKALSMIDEIKYFCSTTSKGEDHSDR